MQENLKDKQNLKHGSGQLIAEKFAALEKPLNVSKKDIFKDWIYKIKHYDKTNNS